MPKFTGYWTEGVRLMASPARMCTSSPQPVEQKPHTIVVVASGLSRVGTCPNPKPPGERISSRVSTPPSSRSRRLAR